MNEKVYKITLISLYRFKLTRFGQEINNNDDNNNNAWRKGNLQMLGNIVSGHHQTSGDERKKIKKEYFRRTRKLLETKICSRNLPSWLFV